MAMLPKLDLAIVGGGIAGLYCCLRAREIKKVALFEATNRIGGKIETVSMTGFDAEYGAMRFDPMRQVMVGRLIQELGIETEPFPEYSCPPVAQQRTIFYGRGGANGIPSNASNPGKIVLISALSRYKTPYNRIISGSYSKTDNCRIWQDSYGCEQFSSDAGENSFFKQSTAIYLED